MPSWQFTVFVLAVWCLWVVGAVSQCAAEDARRGVPPGQRHGVSILPVIPVFPAAMWGVAWLIDLAVSPLGTWIVGVAHGALVVGFLVSILRDWRYLRSLDGSDGLDR